MKGVSKKKVYISQLGWGPLSLAWGLFELVWVGVRMREIQLKRRAAWGRESKNRFEAFVHLGVAKACEYSVAQCDPLTKQLWRPARRTIQSRLKYSRHSRSFSP